MEAKKLLDTLVKKELVSQKEADKVAREAPLVGKSVEELLYQRRVLDEIELTKVRSELLGIPYQKVNVDEIGMELMKLIPAETAHTYQVIPISREGKMLVVGMLNPEDTRAQEALRFVAKQERVDLGVYLVTPADIELVLRRYSPYKSEIQEAVKSLDIKLGSGASPFQQIVHLEEESDISEEAPVIKIVASTLKAAVEQRASDIHIEPQRSRVRVRFRIDGELQEVTSLPLELHQPVVSRIKVLSKLKIDEMRVPQDGRFRTIIFGRDIDFRVATFPTPVGEKVALRVLDPTVGLKGVEHLGLTGQNKELLKEAIGKPFGMILITGPTGSGKTTTLYAFLQILNQESSNVISLEDPVEYFVDGINQSQVRPEIGYTFASGLRQILRQDPDVIMVGEIRDSETASLAIHAALTGHIVFSTLHTNNAVGVIPRLVDMGVDSFLLPAALNLMLAQRLVPRLCDKCKRVEKAPAAIQKTIAEEIGKMPGFLRDKLPYKEPYQIYRSPGCKACNDKGTLGRIAIFEVLSMTREMAEIIGAGISEGKIIEESKRQGMVSLRGDGILKALLGLVPIEAVLRETSEF